LNLFASAGIPAGPVYRIDETFKDLHVTATKRIQELQHPILGNVRQTAPPLSFDGQTASPASAPPLLGQHTVEILQQFGFSAGEVSGLLRKNVVVEQALF